MVDSFLQCELRGSFSGSSFTREQDSGPLLGDEVKPLDANRPVCPAAVTAAGRDCFLEVAVKDRLPTAKINSPSPASCDELDAPFSEAGSATVLRLRTGGNIQVRKGGVVMNSIDLRGRCDLSVRNSDVLSPHAKYAKDERWRSEN